MKLLLKLFVKDYENIKDENVRSKYGKVSSLFGIFLNVCLFLMKFIVGTLFSSVSIKADAFNNLSDAGSSIVSYISFLYSSKPADEDHPFGHARFEYAASLGVSFFILLFAYELIVSSCKHIMHPTTLIFDRVMIVVLLISICVKGYMYAYNHTYGNKIKSNMMKTTAVDSLSDCLSTSAVLIAILISHFTSVNLDAYMGIVVAIFIIKSGIDIVRDTINKIVGEAPTKDYRNHIKEFIESYPGILGIHDLVIHSYGENQVFISAHAEVDASNSIIEAHTIIDKIERDMKQKEGVDLVIHLDPVEMDDEMTTILKNKITNMVKDIDESLSIHDFHIVKKETHNHIMFDIEIPFDCKHKQEDILESLQLILPKEWNHRKNEYVINFDSAYTTYNYSET